MENGYIKIFRKLHNSNMWVSEPFSRAQAWVDLIMLANWKDGFIRVAGQRVDVLRGQCGWSEIRLAERWKWSREKTRSFLKELVNDKQITKKTNTRTTIITICNYSLYQDNNSSDQTTDQTTETHQKNIRPDTIEERKERKERKEYIYAEKFLQFWEVYPRKINKAKAKKIFYQLLKKGIDHEAIIAGARNYNEETRGTEERYIAHATTWLNGERWKDEKTNLKKLLTLEEMKAKFL